MCVIVRVCVCALALHSSFARACVFHNNAPTLSPHHSWCLQKRTSNDADGDDGLSPKLAKEEPSTAKVKKEKKDKGKDRKKRGKAEQQSKDKRKDKTKSKKKKKKAPEGVSEARFALYKNLAH